MDRREIIKSIVIGGAAGLLPGVSFAGYKDRKPIFEGNRILFQGDSITDAGRDRNIEKANNSSALGRGYVSQIAGSLLRNNPDKNYQLFNKGVSGNKVFQLHDRWEDDCFALNPDILSILIGVNDYWHFRNGKYDGTTEIYKTDYQALINRTFEKFPDIKIIIGEPFIVKGGTAVSEEWEEPFSVYKEIAQNVAKEFDLTFVPYQKWFDDALKEAPASYWCPDGVHPSIAGANLMAEAWLHSFSFL